MKIKYQSIQDERSESGRSDSITYYGSYEEMSALLEEQQISPEDSGRKVVSAMVSQSEGDLWQCEIKYQNSLGNPSVSAPDDSYGKKSAQLSGGMLSMPLESHKEYRVCWNHYLAAVKEVTAVPSWWNTATSAVLNDSDGARYTWLKSISELPVGKDNNGKEWRILKDPLKPGVESYDVRRIR